MNLFWSIDQNIEFKPTVFDAIQMIEDAWNKVSGQTIINCFNHSRINFKKIDNEDIEVEPEEFVNTQDTISRLACIFWVTNALNDCIVIDKDVETVGMEIEVLNYWILL